MSRSCLRSLPLLVVLPGVFLGFSMLPRPQTNVGSVLDTLDISIPGTVLCASTYAS